MADLIARFLPLARGSLRRVFHGFLGVKNATTAIASRHQRAPLAQQIQLAFHLRDSIRADVVAFRCDQRRLCLRNRVIHAGCTQILKRAGRQSDFFVCAPLLRNFSLKRGNRLLPSVQRLSLDRVDLLRGFEPFFLRLFERLLCFFLRLGNLFRR